MVHNAAAQLSEANTRTHIALIVPSYTGYLLSLGLNQNKGIRRGDCLSCYVPVNQHKVWGPQVELCCLSPDETKTGGDRASRLCNNLPEGIKLFIFTMLLYEKHVQWFLFVHLL